MKRYVVGGAVRDQLLGIPSNDFDYLLVGATASDIADLRSKGFSEVGVDFPVYLDPETGDQWALARRERKTGVGYLGFSTEHGSDVTLQEDLSRRDLTVNAIAIDFETGDMLDYFGGLRDLRDKVLRHVTDAFKEDPLRVIRLARFYARFSDWTVAPETVAFAREIVLSGEMEYLSAERYWAEIEKVFEQSSTPGRFWEALHNFGVLEHVSFFKHGMRRDFTAQQVIRHVVPTVNAIGQESWTASQKVVAAFTMLSSFEAQFVKPTTQLQKIHSAFHTAVSGVSPEQMLQLMSMLSANQRSNDNFELFVDIVGLAEKLKMPLSVSRAALVKAAREAWGVTAEKYLHLEGKAIGDAMRAEKLARMTVHL